MATYTNGITQVGINTEASMAHNTLTVAYTTASSNGYAVVFPSFYYVSGGTLATGTAVSVEIQAYNNQTSTWITTISGWDYEWAAISGANYYLEYERKALASDGVQTGGYALHALSGRMWGGGTPSIMHESTADFSSSDTIWRYRKPHGIILMPGERLRAIAAFTGGTGTGYFGIKGFEVYV
jgi:hypothetical protein